METCPNCGVKVLVLMTNYATLQQFCHNCALQVSKAVMPSSTPSKEKRDPDMTTWCYDDLLFLRDAGCLDWEMAGLLMFQRLIRAVGTPEEQERLAAMGVGFEMPRSKP